MQRDQLRVKLNESKNYAEFLKESIDKEEKRRTKVNDELRQLKENTTTVGKSVKELQTMWDDIKIQIKKFLVVVEVCAANVCYKQKKLMIYFVKIHANNL